MSMEKMTLAVLIDADNISAASAGEIFKKACAIGEPIVRRAYGMVNCFSGEGGWRTAQREYGIVARPQVSNVSGKNVADIALVIDAMEFLYKSSCPGICIVSNDSDFTALASKIREGGKAAYRFGGATTPTSFRVPCAQFFELAIQKQVKPPKVAINQSMTCPRCSGKLTDSWTKSNKPCRVCATCGGMSAKISTLKKVFTAESLQELVSRARLHEQTGCVCPDCGSVMSLLKVASGKQQIEIDVCGNCQTIWYDNAEFESLVPNDGVLTPTISAGKAYRRELVASLAADLRSGRRKIPDLGNLKVTLKKVFHTPAPDIMPVIGALMCQQIIRVDKKSGKIQVLGSGT